jgi:hypothetical protein
MVTKIQGFPEQKYSERAARSKGLLQKKKTNEEE